MNIQKIKIIDNDTIVITTVDNQVLWFNKNDLSGPHRSWFDNILACSTSLVNETSQK